MWTCSICGRNFKKLGQPHSCHNVPLEEHFKNKEIAKELFTLLLNTVREQIGNCTIISLPCCVHLYGTYDFLAALPRKDSLEIRFALNRKLHTRRLLHCVPITTHLFKNCIKITDKKDINEALISLLDESYHIHK